MSYIPVRASSVVDEIKIRLYMEMKPKEVSVGQVRVFRLGSCLLGVNFANSRSVEQLIVRGCANQKFSTNQIKLNDSFRFILEVYA